MSKTLYPWSAGGGTTLATKQEAATWARRLLTTEAYRTRLERDLIAGTLPPALEVLLYHYAFGKPIDQLEVNVTNHDLTTMSLEQLEEMSIRLTKELSEARALADALPAEVLNVA